MQNITIDITKRGVAPLVNVTDYDAMSRFFALTILDGGAPYTPPDGATYSVWYKNNESHGWYDTITEPDDGTHPAVTADGNVLTVEIAAAATTSCGELAVMITGADGYQLTVTGIMTRSADIPGYDGEEVENYYNVYITRMQENAARAENAADIAVAYGATVEVDEAAQQLNITHHSDTEGGVGWLFGSAIMTDASGSVAAFSDGANDVAVKSLVAEITPVQSGSGDPSPSNIRPISGWTGMTVTRAGKNLLNGDNVTLTRDGTRDHFWNLGATIPAGTYTFSCDVSNATNARNVVIGFRKTGLGTNYGTVNIPSGTSGRFSATVTISDSVDRLYVYISTLESSGVTITLSNPQVEFGTSASEYAPYVALTTYPISWQTEAGTVYGGTLDVVSGVLTVNRFFKAFDGTEDWARTGSIGANTNRYYIQWSNMGITGNVVNLSNSMCSHLVFLSGNVGQFGTFNASTTNFAVKDGDGTQFADMAAFKAWLATQNTNGTPLQLCVELATPIATVQLSPTKVKTLLGGNSIFTDAGSVSVDYIADTKLYIDNKVAELQALILEN